MRGIGLATYMDLLLRDFLPGIFVVAGFVFFVRERGVLPEITPRRARLELAASITVVLITFVGAWLVFSVFYREGVVIWFDSVFYPKQFLPPLIDFIVIVPVLIVVGLLRMWGRSIRLTRSHWRFSVLLGLVASIFLAFPVLDNSVVQRLELMGAMNVALTLASTFGEALIFRGMLQPLLERFLGTNIGIVCSSVVFLAWHAPLWFIGYGYSPSEFVLAVIAILPVALSYGYIAQRSDNLAGSILLQILYDLPRIV